MILSVDTPHIYDACQPQSQTLPMGCELACSCNTLGYIITNQWDFRTLFSDWTSHMQLM